MNLNDSSFKNSIINVVDPEMMRMGSGNPLMDELQIFGSLYQQKLLEKIDRDDITNAGRRAFKLLIISLAIGGSLNRLLTKKRIFGRDFLNLNLLIRLPIRFIILMIPFYPCFYSPMMVHMFKLREYLNEKYTPRMRRFTLEMDPFIMNPNMVNEPGMTEEDKEYIGAFVDRMRSEGESRKLQLKMMEENAKRK